MDHPGTLLLECVHYQRAQSVHGRERAFVAISKEEVTQWRPSN